MLWYLVEKNASTERPFPRKISTLNHSQGRTSHKLTPKVFHRLHTESLVHCCTVQSSPSKTSSCTRELQASAVHSREKRERNAPPANFIPAPRGISHLTITCNSNSYESHWSASSTHLASALQNRDCKFTVNLCYKSYNYNCLNCYHRYCIRTEHTHVLYVHSHHLYMSLYFLCQNLCNVLHSSSYNGCCLHFSLTQMCCMLKLRIRN